MTKQIEKNMKKNDNCQKISYGIVTADFVRNLRHSIPHEQVIWVGDPDANLSHIRRTSKDKSWHPSQEPYVVVLAHNAKEVAHAVRCCYNFRIPVTARGAGTGLEGAAIPYPGSVVIDMSKYKKFKLIASEQLVRVGAGIRKLELNKLLSRHGLIFGPDPASNPSLGGMASTGGSGMSTLRYGTTRENVVALVVVTAEGKILTTRRSVRKSSTGYDLTQLFLGAEGTLGVICELVLRVHKIQKIRCGAVVGFPDIHSAVSAVVQIRNTDVPSLMRCELLNKQGVIATNMASSTELTEQPTLFLEFYGNNIKQTQSDADHIKEIIHRHNASNYKFAKDGSSLDKLWEARRGCYFAALQYRGVKGDKAYITDVCVPISCIAQCVTETECDFLKANVPCIICAHIIDGNFHCIIPFKTETEKKKLKKIETRLIDRALALGGTVSGEHGVGIGKKKHILREHGADNIELMRRIKQALDVHSILNPGKLFQLNSSL